MIYTSLTEILSAAMGLSTEEDVEQLQRLGVLIGVYHKALHNPPDGVIGVGAITYAEQSLITHQKETTHA